MTTPTESPNRYPVGAIVRLRSGGPNMTVIEVEDLLVTQGVIDRRLCAWFVLNSPECHQVLLPIAALSPGKVRNLGPKGGDAPKRPSMADDFAPEADEDPDVGFG